MADTILITGAGGFIGSYLARLLLSKGKRLVLASRSIALLPKQATESGLAKVVQVNDWGQVEPEMLLDGVDLVIHLAALSGNQKNATEADYWRFNADLTGALVEASSKGTVRRFIHLSSLGTLTPNTHDQIVSDNTKPNPNTPYGRSKKAADEHVARFGGLAVSLRPPLVIGAEAKGNWALLQAIAATGLPLPFASAKALRHYVSLETLAQALFMLSTCDPEPSRSGAYVLADPTAVALPDVVEALRLGMDQPRRLLAFPPALLLAAGTALGRKQQLSGLLGSLQVDDTRFRATFGFSQTSDITAAIRLSGANYLARRKLPVGSSQ